MRHEPGQKVLHYRLVDKIGEGGMGQVWRAEDTRLGREVAIKFLHGEVVADAGRRTRFEQEARAVAALSHPGIVTLFSIEEAEGSPFLVLEHIVGKPLDEGPIGSELPRKRFLEIAKAVVDAVAAAHLVGIVHRDLKPENVMLSSDGRVKVLDFGLAKLRDDSPLIVGDGSASTTMTQAGTLLGTLSYMSPEQAQGRPVDARSDVFSLGILLHLLATGNHPFPGDHPISIISSIVKDRPPALRASRPDLPVEFERLLDRCLEKDPQRRFASAVELGDALEALQAEPGVAPEPRRPRLRKERLAAIGVATLALVGLASWLVLQRAPVAPPAPGANASVAILPFQNSGEALDAEFALGIHDDLINQVSRVGTMKVISRTSVMALPAGHLTIPQIGEQLQVGAVMEGSVRRAGDQIRVNVSLIDARSEEHLWGNSYDREFTAQNVFAIQTEIALEVAAALKVTLSPTDQRTLASTPTDNIGALEAFRLARTAARGSPSPEQINDRVSHLERAVALDPDFAQAWAALSTAHLQLYWRGIDRSPARRETARKALETAAGLQPALPEVAMARGFYHYWGFRAYDEALAEFVTAERGLPNNADLLAAQAFIQRRLGRWEESLVLLDRAIELDPLNVYLVHNRASTLLTMRRYDDAVETVERLTEIDPEGPWDEAIARYVFFQTGEAGQFIHAMRNRASTFDHEFTEFLIALAFEERDPQALDLLDSTPGTLAQGQVHWIPKSLVRAEILSRLGRADEAREEYADAERRATAALVDAPEDPRIHAALGLASAGLGKAEAAVDAARRAAALVPYEKDAMDAGVYSWNLALVLARSGRRDEALRQVDVYLSLPGFYSEAWVRAHPDFAEWL